MAAGVRHRRGASGEGILTDDLSQAPPSVFVLGCRVDQVDESEAIGRIMRLMRAGKAAHVVTLGAEMAVLASNDEPYRSAINSSDLVVPDTIGVVLASKLLGRSVSKRIAGIELAEQLVKRCAEDELSVYFLGAAHDIAAKATDEFLKRYPNLHIAGWHHGYFIPDEEPDIAQTIRESAANLVLVGMGFPRQEFWIRRNIDRIGPATCVGVGGAFDVWSGRLKRAPGPVRRAGMEWLYRLISEPHRFGRQLALPRFAVRVTAQAIRERLAARKAGRARGSDARAASDDADSATEPNEA